MAHLNQRQRWAIWVTGAVLLGILVFPPWWWSKSEFNVFQGRTPKETVDAFIDVLRQQGDEGNSARLAFRQLQKKYPKGADDRTLLKELQALDPLKYPFASKSALKAGGLRVDWFFNRPKHGYDAGGYYESGIEYKRWGTETALVLVLGGGLLWVLKTQPSSS
ncbi:MAG: hypothetical protein ABSH31_07460 [Bryobacteraceae bacterium]|jgi:hypothetical protein